MALFIFSFSLVTSINKVWQWSYRWDTVWSQVWACWCIKSVHNGFAIAIMLYLKSCAFWFLFCLSHVFFLNLRQLLGRRHLDTSCRELLNLFGIQVSLRLIYIPHSHQPLKLTVLHQGLFKYLTAQDTCDTPTITKHKRTPVRLGNLQTRSLIKVNWGLTEGFKDQLGSCGGPAGIPMHCTSSKYKVT